jgi:ATP-dependent Clp protease ATP-binding subunit ClpC
MTSNWGAFTMVVPVIGERERELVMAEVRRFFRPEFLNRLDDIIMFHQLTPEQLAEVLELLLRKEVELLQRQGVTLEIAPEAKRWMLAQNDEPEFGARPLRRIIARFLREPLADYLLTRRSPAESRVVVTAGPDGLSFEHGRRPEESRS